ncbi:MAG: insulinase family protein [Eggerthellaceae bacterium]
MSNQMKEGQELFGFTVASVQELPELDGRAYILRHERSGAKLLYLANDDVNKAFSIAFKTPPADSTGVFHILEHSVLCGSEKFPVKEPFVNLLKGSMQTFLNAMTFPDKTMYPVASTNEQDLLNLMDVYMDAVLHPNIYSKPTIFAQEGWHYEVDDQGQLSYNGVVLNEMKGALSDSDSVLYDQVCAALFPDTAYRFESGGDPEAIVDLTYEQFLDTHSRHYRLDNSMLMLYGDMQVEKFLQFLDERYLTPDAGLHKEAGAPNELAVQEPVCNLGVRYEMATAPENSTCAVAYVVGKSTDDVRIMAADILLDALAGSNEAPLKRALIDADLADDVSSCLADGMLQPFVMLQLRGLKEGAADRFEDVVRDCVQDILAKGLDHELIEAALSHAEFVMRERNFGIADGVAFAMSSAAGWLYDEDGALTYLRYEDTYAFLRQALQGTYFEDLTRSLFLENDHRASVEVVPVVSDGDSKEAARLQQVAAGLSEDDLQDLRDQVVALREAQERPDTPEELATLPHLGVSDIGPAPQLPSYEVDESGAFPVIRHGVSTHGIVYVYRYYGLESVAFDELPYVSILAGVLGKLDTAQHTAAEIDTLCQANLGNLSCFTEVHARLDSADLLPKLVLGGSALPPHIDALASIPAEVALQTRFLTEEGTADPGAASKVRDLLTQRKVALEQNFANNGHSAAIARVSTYYSRAAVLRGAMGGVNMYRFLKGLLADFDAVADSLMAKLQELAERIFRPDNCTMSFAGPQECLGRYQELCASTIDAEPVGLRPAAVLEVPDPVPASEAFVVPTDVTFSALGFDRKRLGSEYGGAWLLASRVLSYDYLWNEVRVKGGAYGTGFQVIRNGDLRFYSYRDPHLDETYERFAQAGAWLGAFAPTDDELEGYIVSAVSSLDAPVKPRSAARRQDGWYFAGYDVSEREAIRRQLIETTADDLRGLGDVVSAVSDQGYRCVFGNREAIESSSLSWEVIDLLGE